MPPEGLTIGRNVHFVEQNGHHKAGIVSGVNDPLTGEINVSVFSGMVETPVYVIPSAQYSSDHLPGTWHYIERA